MTPLLLSVKGLGHVVAFKNSKMLARGKLITNPRKQKWMEAATLSIESQLRSWFRTNGIETGTGPTALCRIAYYMPLDDSLKWIPEHSVKSLQVLKGHEGAIISIEPI